jgi:hypothetical protein
MFVPTASIAVVWFALRKPFVVLDFRLVPLGALVRSACSPSGGYGAKSAA